MRREPLLTSDRPTDYAYDCRPSLTPAPNVSHMTRALRSLLPLAAIGASACFHQVVQTGLPAGTVVIDRPFVSTWIFGIVAAKELDLREQCPTGAATIETEQSFVNGLVGVVTLGIYTPQHVRVTCAAGSGTGAAPAAEVHVAADASESERADAFRRAAEQCIGMRVPVTVRF